MRILLLTQVVPYPPDSGPKIKTYHVLNYLARKHEVHLVSFVRPGPEAVQAEKLRHLCASVTTVPLRRSAARDVAHLLRSFVSGRPFLIERDDSAVFRSAVRNVMARFDFAAVHADQLSMGQFAAHLALPLRVLDQHNAVWTIVRQSASRERGIRRVVAELEWRKLRAYEGAICPRFDRVTVVTDRDRAELASAARRPIRSMEIPIAIDTQDLAFIDRSPLARRVLSVATMFYPPNVDGVRWFAAQVFPLVRERIPDTRFSIVGARPPASVRALAGAETGIDVTGYLPDLGAVLRESAVVVVPLHAGSGMRVKILDSFARGIPVVSTTLGVEGIAARPDEHLLVADTPVAFARAVSRILCEPDTAARLAAAARRLVVERYDWRTALAPLDELYPPTSAATVA